MGYWRRFYVSLGVDTMIIVFSISMSYVFRFTGDISQTFLYQMILFSMISIIVTPISMNIFKLYNQVWRYVGIREMIALIKAVLLSNMICYVIVLIVEERGIPLSIFLLSAETMLLLLGSVRLLRRIRVSKVVQINDKERSLIIGAGSCGIFICRELENNTNSKLKPIIFIDDDSKKHKHHISGILVVGGRTKIIEAVEIFKIQHIIIAMPSVAKEEISLIIDICKCTKAKLKIIPSLGSLIEGKVSINQIRDVEVEDLLGRDPINVDLKGISEYLNEKNILVTGAGGTIGSELCRQISLCNPTKLLLLGRGENSIHTILLELKRKFPNIKTEPIIADVRDSERMDEVFQLFRPHVVFHAAAHKHVTLMEMNPTEAVKNNVFGTKIVADCADRYHADRFVLVSSDKAVNPTSIMGATKRAAEIVVQNLGEKSNTIFSIVRFGNVLGSRGSVIPIFKDQIAYGGPVTVTHPDMVRYFMTIPEAVQLVIQAGALATGGDLFILDMGKPVRILDLAKDLIRLSGFEIDEIPIMFTGIGPGEKLFEELLTEEEELCVTKHNRIFSSKKNALPEHQLNSFITALEEAVADRTINSKEILKKMIQQ